MRPAFPALLFALMLASTSLGCTAPGAEASLAANDEPHAVAATPQRGAELYGRYCTGCHAGAVRTSLARDGAPWLMHIQARVGMGTMPSSIPEALTHDDVRQIVDYLDASRSSRLDD
jgi:cytochrome c5